MSEIFIDKIDKIDSLDGKKSEAEENTPAEGQHAGINLATRSMLGPSTGHNCEELNFKIFFPVVVRFRLL